MGLTNAQYNTIMRDYQKQQTLAHARLEERIAEVYQKFPILSEIDEQIASTSTATARRMLLDDTGDLGILRAQISKLSDTKNQILRQAGYPADYLQIEYKCPDCQDTGYIDSKKCHCFRQAAIDLLYMQSNLREVLNAENFSTFSLDHYSDSVVDPVTGLNGVQTALRAYDECIHFVREFDNHFGNLFLYGDTGVGKTFLSNCVAKALLDSTHSVLYFSSLRLFELFADKTFRNTNEEERDEAEQHIFDTDLLIIDDLGTEVVNSFVSSELFHIINERILRKKSTLISTNLSLATFMDTYSERVFSRITSSYTMIKLIGGDIRMQKKLSGNA